PAFKTIRANLWLESSRQSLPQLRACLVHTEVVNSVTETPHGPVLWEIARSIRTMFELLPSVIRRSTVQKKCQEGVNTRENASSRRAAYVYHDARAHPQSIVLAGSFRSCSFLLPEISQTCSQLIHTSFMAALASGLET